MLWRSKWWVKRYKRLNPLIISLRKQSKRKDQVVREEKSSRNQSLTKIIPRTPLKDEVIVVRHFLNKKFPLKKTRINRKEKFGIYWFRSSACWLGKYKPKSLKNGNIDKIRIAIFLQGALTHIKYNIIVLRLYFSNIKA